jgi:pre-mRNA-splicing factor ATP-dependent RNA helicase DHX15/PRP43
MQVAKKEANSKTYTTAKDNQIVLLHPSTLLGQESEWVVYNGFVLTTENYIRTVMSVRGEWLLNIAPNYYDISTFKKGEVRAALDSFFRQRIDCTAPLALRSNLHHLTAP